VEGGKLIGEDRGIVDLGVLYKVPGTPLACHEFRAALENFSKQRFSEGTRGPDCTATG
jgi:hypothetical protein